MFPMKKVSIVSRVLTFFMFYTGKFTKEEKLKNDLNTNKMNK